MFLYNLDSRSLLTPVHTSESLLQYQVINIASNHSGSNSELKPSICMSKITHTTNDVYITFETYVPSIKY